MVNWLNIVRYWITGMLAIVLISAAYLIIKIEGIMAVVGFVFVPFILGLFTCILVGMFRDD